MSVDLTASDRAAASGIYLASYYLGGLCGSLVLGMVYAHWGWPAAVLGIAISLVAAGALSLARRTPAGGGNYERAHNQPIVSPSPACAGAPSPICPQRPRSTSCQGMPAARMRLGTALVALLLARFPPPRWSSICRGTTPLPGTSMGLSPRSVPRHQLRSGTNSTDLPGRRGCGGNRAIDPLPGRRAARTTRPNGNSSFSRCSVAAGPVVDRARLSGRPVLRCAPGRDGHIEMLRDSSAGRERKPQSCAAIPTTRFRVMSFSVAAFEQSRYDAAGTNWYRNALASAATLEHGQLLPGGPEPAAVVSTRTVDLRRNARGSDGIHQFQPALGFPRRSSTSPRPARR